MLLGENDVMNSFSSYNNRTAIKPSGFGGWLKGLMGGAVGEIDPVTGVEKPGWGGLALDTAQALGGAWMGMKQYGMAKDQLKFQKQAFNKNYAAQKQTMNTQLEDRQRARIASNAGAYESLDPYMQKNGIR